MTPAEVGSTREKILEISRGLISEHGYSGTSISQIAGRLGTSKAALYYHFRSKEEILDALLSEPMDAFQELARNAAGKQPNELLGSIIDLVSGPCSCLATFQSDPSVLAEYAKGHNLEECESLLITALVGPRPGAAKVIKARAALMVAKHGTMAALASGPLTPPARAEILAAALRALDWHPAAAE